MSILRKNSGGCNVERIMNGETGIIINISKS